VVRCRAGAVTKTVLEMVPALRSGKKNAAPRPGHETGRALALPFYFVAGAGAAAGFGSGLSCFFDQEM
jgi:hypothetical protein